MFRLKQCGGWVVQLRTTMDDSSLHAACSDHSAGIVVLRNTTYTEASFPLMLSSVTLVAAPFILSQSRKFVSPRGGLLACIHTAMFASWRVDAEYNATGAGRFFDAAEIVAAGKRSSSHLACKSCRAKKVRVYM